MKPHIVLLSGALLGHATIASAQMPDVVFDLKVEGGRVAPNMRLIRVKQGDAVRLRWTSDRPIILHLHGYDIETEGRAGRDRANDLHGTRDRAFPGRGTQARCARRALPWRGSACPHRGPPALAGQAPAPAFCAWRHCWRSPQPPEQARRQPRTASASATSSPCRCRSTCSARRPWSSSPSSCSRCSCAAPPDRAATLLWTCWPARSAGSSADRPSCWCFGLPCSRFSLSQYWPA